MAEVELEARAGIVVTSYERSGRKQTPILTHIFWGDNLEQALGYAKSHLVTDFFFSSSFTGEMRWKEGALSLSVNMYGVGNEDLELEDRKELTFTAREINEQQIQEGYERVIQRLAKKQD